MADITDSIVAEGQGSEALMTLGLIFTLSLLVEAITPLLIDFLPLSLRWLKPRLGPIVAVSLALIYNADLPALMGLPRLSYIGPVVTGLVIARGSSFVSLFYDRWHNHPPP